MPTNPVSLEVVLENARLKYPQYRNVPDKDLTKALVTKYPSYRTILTEHSKAVADVLSGKHDPLGILDSKTSVRALRAKYPELQGSDQDLEAMISGDTLLRERLTEDPTSVISSKYRPFTRAEIADMPKFLQDIAAKKATLGIENPPMPGDIASVYPKSTAIDIDNSDQFDRGAMAHELVHAYQNTRTGKFTSPNPDYKNAEKTYDYGGMPGLMDARRDRKTIANFSVEQQAKMVEHYYDAHRDMMKQGKVSAETAKDFEEMKQAYGPFIRQMAGVPTDEDLYKPITGPTPPGVPGYEATGYITGDPNIADFMIKVEK